MQNKKCYVFVENMKKVGVGCFKKVRFSQPLGVKLKNKINFVKKKTIPPKCKLPFKIIPKHFLTNTNSGLIWIMTRLNCSYLLLAKII